MSRWEEYLLFEDFGVCPMDHTFWDYVEENPDYVSRVISAMEETLIRAFPNILKQLGIRERRKIGKSGKSSLRKAIPG
jgi:hypothetical protein